MRNFSIRNSWAFKISRRGKLSRFNKFKINSALWRPLRRFLLSKMEKFIGGKNQGKERRRRMMRKRGGKEIKIKILPWKIVRAFIHCSNGLKGKKKLSVDSFNRIQRFYIQKIWVFFFFCLDKSFYPFEICSREILTKLGLPGRS